MAALDSNKVTGVSVVSNATDAANKTYADSVLSGGVPSTTGNAGKFLSVYPGAAYWVLRTSGTTSQLNALTFANNTYVVGGANGTLNTSTDTITWTLRTSGFGGGVIGSLAFGNNLYVAVASGVLNTSTDTITWTLRTSGFAFTQINALTFANDLYVAGGASGRLSTYLLILLYHFDKDLK
jgi:hypothetical protein